MSSLFAPLARTSKTSLRGNSDNSCPFCPFSSRANYLVRSILLFHYRCAMWCHSGKLGQKWELKLRLVEILRAYFKSWMHYRPWTDAQVNYTHENAGRKKLSVWLVIFMFILNYLTLYLATVRWVITLTAIRFLAHFVVVSLRWTRTWISALYCVLHFPKGFLVIPSSRGSRFLDVSEHFTWFHWRTKDQRINPCPYLSTE